MTIQKTEYPTRFVRPGLSVERHLRSEVLRVVEDAEFELKNLGIASLTDDAMEFIKSVLNEAVLTRLPEAKKVGLPISTTEQMLEYFHQIVVKLSMKALEFSEDRSADSLPLIGPIHLIQGIHDAWCNIFPFCRPTPQDPPEPPTPPSPQYSNRAS